MKANTNNHGRNSRDNNNNNMAFHPNDQQSTSREDQLCTLHSGFFRDLYNAYGFAKKGKKSGEIDHRMCYLEQELLQLTQELQKQTYTPGKHRVFIVHDPVCREIRASPFRDRIIHHLIHGYINPVIEKMFIDDSYGARVGKGIHYGIRRVEHFIKSCKHTYGTAYVMKIDIKNFFHSIDKTILKSIINQLFEKKTIHCPLGKEWLYTLITSCITRDPKNDYTVIGHFSDRDNLPHHKSLFSVLPGVGLPLGHLTSQLWANVYLHNLDRYIKNILKVKRYGRYMDDMIFIHHDPEQLMQRKKMITIFLQTHCKLELHPHKLYLQHASKGVPFLGYRIHDRGITLGKRIINNRHAKLRAWNHTPEAIIHGDGLQKVHMSMNTYLGFAHHGHNRHLRKIMTKKLPQHIKNRFLRNKTYTKIRPRVKRVKKKIAEQLKRFYPHIFK